MDIKNSMLLANMMSKKIIPSRYQEVEYIESTGTQYIDTGIERNITHTYRYVGEVSFSDITNRQAMGVQGNAYFGVVNGKYQIGQSGTDTININAVLNTFVPYDITYDIPNQKIYYSIADNLNLERNQYMVNQPPLAHFFLFSLNNGILPCSWKLKPAKIYDNGILVRNFIPVYDTLTNKYGMWESVQGKFYGNDGTGDFKGSIVGYTVVGSPTIVDGVVSGFTTSNYLVTGGLYSGTINNFELNIKFTVPTTYATGYTCSYNTNRNGSNLIASCILGSGGNFTTYLFKKSDNTQQAYSVSYDLRTHTGETFTANIRTDMNNVVINLYNSSGTLVATNSYTEQDLGGTIISGFYLGVSSNQTSYFNGGSIDLNSTYIKINNKLNFNGQQA